jgi:hypothetical protein
MFGNRWLGDLEHRNEFAYATIPMLEYGEHFQTGGIGQRFQHLRQFFDVHILSPSFIINLPYNYMVMKNKFDSDLEMQIVPFGSRSRSPQHDGNSRQANGHPDPAVKIRRFPVHEPSPEGRQNNKDPAVGGIYTAKVREALQGGNDPIQNPPSTPIHIGMDPLSHSQTKYPPPISANPAARNKTIAFAMVPPLLLSRPLKFQQVSSRSPVE